MSHDTKFLTSYDREPLQYISDLGQIQLILSRQLSLDLLSSASEYSRIAEDLKQRIFPETEPAITQAIPTKYFVNELRSSEGKVVFREGFLLDVELSKENGLFFFQNTRFNVFGSGFTKEEALKDFSEFFIHDFFSYKNTSPNDLTRDARQLLDEYESVISTFEPA